MIYIVANANCVSGGPELLHQFCYHLNKQGIDAEMAYYEKLSFPTQKNSDKLIEAYGRYNCHKAKKIEDEPQNVVVLSEGELWFLPRIKRAKVVIWWLSVDNYYNSMNTSYAKLYAPFGMKRKKYNPFMNKYIHCVQSEYARLFLINKGIDANNIYSLSDYLSDEFLDAAQDEQNEVKHNVILYNPKKGFEFTKKIINACQEYEFIALQGLTHAEMVRIMKTSKVYIDFGNHPGKDRIPREAAMCGCCVITNTEGSAGNNVDVNIPKYYKYEMKDENVQYIKERIYECISSYDKLRADFDEYRNEISAQESKFREEVNNISKRLSYYVSN